MKKIFIATAVALSLSAAAQAAESTAVLKVTGVLTNDACTPELDGGGVVDFGTKYISELSATETNQLGHKDLSFRISCTAPTKVGFQISDDRADSPASITIEQTSFTDPDETAWNSAARFGAGQTAGGVNIGAYSIALNRSALTADGQPQTALRLPSGITVWEVWGGTSDILNQAGISYSLGDAKGIPVAFTNAEFPLRIALAVQKTDALAITDNTTIDGQATITLIYL
ncbi:DUF1120 domain-containing protein [Salmonella enterica subsp. salamae]|uniref:DUF1120 domain-containing protein n=4 Tax=Salmonella enterica TaxID=28901 RepID=A0A6C7D978_SALER|nr:DUF1120 domain-containing protein [Salmonella enterica]EAA6221857.1 DUF1120 domain-containing protein [Salmonella enterica subsp. salamae]EBP3807182.1 DUF1120 domain-containing protein [Salmonella enterica subsp. enterica]AXC87513.1 DUF1120 domain-containing protein [Salmonella enterica subsp. salamae serovar 56:b:[1,5]]EAA6245470.1 DUF1120 domain-containing protein [Salmonella enterica subsp. salamae]EAM3921104.1 DUF1120 domain-containing protein [Salmonella enterica]